MGGEIPDSPVAARRAGRPPVRAAVVDDHPVARRGIADVLAESGRFEIAALCGRADELTDPASFGLIVLDLYLDSDEPCLQTVAEFAKAAPVLVISASRRRGDALAVLQAGAHGYLTKDANTAEIVNTAIAIADGFTLSPDLADFLGADLADPALRELAALAEPLSERQHQALDLIAQGYTHGQAARRMGISVTTFDTHIKRIREKLRLGNKAELTRAALELNRLRESGAGGPP
jgi:DNA-binding NarL/FixJ family response regulator